MTFKVRGGRKEIILPQEAETEPKFQPNRPLVVALGKAYKWQEMLDSGEVGSFDELAARYGVDRSYIGRILKLMTLAPRITEVILSGTEPSSLSLRKLNRNLPLLWGEQHKTLGFPTW